MSAVSVTRSGTLNFSPSCGYVAQIQGELTKFDVPRRAFGRSENLQPDDRGSDSAQHNRSRFESETMPELIERVKGAACEAGVEVR